MNYSATICLFLTVIFASHLVRASAQEAAAYKPTDKAEIYACLKAFSENRSKFDTFGCLMEWEQQEVTAPAGTGRRAFKAAIFESAPVKLCRWEVKRKGYSNTQGSDTDSFSLFRANESSWLYTGDATQVHPIDVSNTTLTDFNSVPDPWIVPLASISLVENEKASHKDYWKELLADENLLWAEENKSHFRGEWSFGSAPGQCRIQVYFSKELGRMPVKVRFIRPADKTEPFAELGLSFVSENEITWETFRGGYVPTEVRSNRKEWRDSDRSTKSIKRQTTQLFWDTTLLSQNGAIDVDVFLAGKLSFKTLESSFQKPAVDLRR